jgi:hypothetical protein
MCTLLRRHRETGSQDPVQVRPYVLGRFVLERFVGAPILIFHKRKGNTYVIFNRMTLKERSEGKFKQCPETVR